MLNCRARVSLVSVYNGKTIRYIMWSVTSYAQCHCQTVPHPAMISRRTTSLHATSGGRIIFLESRVLCNWRFFWRPWLIGMLETVWCMSCFVYKSKLWQLKYQSISPNACLEGQSIIPKSNTGRSSERICLSSCVLICLPYTHSCTFRWFYIL